MKKTKKLQEQSVIEDGDDVLASLISKTKANSDKKRAQAKASEQIAVRSKKLTKKERKIEES